MAIMIVSSYLPFPLVNGGNIRLYNLLKFLSRKYEITLICERRSFQTEEDVKEVEKFCKKVITVPRKKQWTISNILKSALSLDSFLVIGHTLPEMKKKIKEELEHNKFDLIHVETFYVMQNLPKTTIPVVLVEHNVEYLVYKKFVDHSPIFLRLFLSWDVIKMKKREESFWKKVNSLIAVSDIEKKIMNANSVVSNGVDIEKFKPKHLSYDNEKRALFIGDFKWIENRDIARWIINHIWPKIKIKEIKLWIVGRNIPNDIKTINDSNIIIEENAPSDTSLIYDKSFILLSPIRIGGGTSFKILEAMASGVPVVTTKLGAEGIGGKDRETLLIGKTDREIADCLEELVTNPDLFRKISKNARKLIEEKYSWNSIGEKLERVYKEVLND